MFKVITEWETFLYLLQVRRILEQLQVEGT